MNALLQTLEREGDVTRTAEAPVGKVIPARLTPQGRQRLQKSTAAVGSVEVRMLAGMTETEQSDAFRALQSMVRSLREKDDLTAADWDLRSGCASRAAVRCTLRQT